MLGSSEEIKMTTNSTATGSTSFYGFLDVVNGKGPCRETENVYKKAKLVYKKMLGLCRPLARERLDKMKGGRYILLPEDPRTVGCAPGLKQQEAMEEMKEELVGQFNKLINADRVSGDRARRYDR